MASLALPAREHQSGLIAMVWSWLNRRQREKRLLSVVDRLEELGDGLEKHNALLAKNTPTVGLYETFQVNTGRGVVDVVLYDLELQPGPDGCPKIVSGRIMDRPQFDSMLSPETISRAAQA